MMLQMDETGTEVGDNVVALEGLVGSTWSSYRDDLNDNNSRLAIDSGYNSWQDRVMAGTILFPPLYN
jgi:hypothetical protein